jgi:hypothetical protein
MLMTIYPAINGWAIFSGAGFTTACRVMAKRLRDVCGLPESEPLWRAGRGFVVRDLPWTVEKLRVIPPFEFENWAVIALGGIPNKPNGFWPKRLGLFRRPPAEPGHQRLFRWFLSKPIVSSHLNGVVRPVIADFPPENGIFPARTRFS